MSQIRGESERARMSVYHSAVSPHKSTSLFLDSTNSFSEESEIRLEQKTVFAQPSFTHYRYQPLNKTPPKSLIFPPFTPKISLSTITLLPIGGVASPNSPRFRIYHSSERQSVIFDFFSCLPPEICVHVLLYLHPQDLCK